ncbi:hypothetical protein F8388_026754 [Cannabis sativa]|uniref:Uncharacterized protein n=1 Tax=Cannabis sativa TaxID=3483 RepID=A0A7J6H1S1_CANSA|nr:hypothetical protein F8388_026754 [Cannabis sativa]
MARQVKQSIFFRPSHESAIVARTNPPIRQPVKKADSGKLVRMDPAHCKPHSDMVDVGLIVCKDGNECLLSIKEPCKGDKDGLERLSPADVSNGVFND